METQNSKLISLSISSFQKLISFNAAPLSGVAQILDILLDQINTPMDLQLKILQTILPLVSHYPVHKNLLANTLLIALKLLQDQKNAVVANTAAVTFRQIIQISFEKVSANEDDPLSILRDICAMTDGAEPVFLKSFSIAKAFGLELIEAIISNNVQVFTKVFVSNS